MEAARFTTSGSREEGAYPNDLILSVRPPVLLSYDPRVDSSIEKGTDFLGTPLSKPGSSTALRSLLSRSRSLMSIIHFPGCPLASLGHMDITTNHCSREEAWLWGSFVTGRDRLTDTSTVMHIPPSLPLLRPLPQRLGVHLTPGPEQRRPPSRVASSHSHP